MSVSLKKEWLGESGYCNCLLVVMSRMRVLKIELVSNQPPPNLELLTPSRPNTHAWIQAQEFDYPMLDPTVIIQMFAELSGIKKSFWGYRRGTIIAHDCVEDDGPVVERMFLVRLTHSKGLLRLTIDLETI